MRTRLLLFILFIGLKGFTQSTVLTLPNIKNEFEIKVEKNVNDGINIFITDSKNNSVLQRIVVKKDDTESTFTSAVFDKIKASTDYYVFNLGIENKEVRMHKDSINDEKVLNAVTELKEESFVKLLKQKTIFNNDSTKTTYKDFLKKIPKENDEIAVFKGNNEYKFKRVKNDKINFIITAEDTTMTDIKDEADFYKRFFANYKSNTTVIKNVVFNTDDIKKIKNIDFNNELNKSKLGEIFKEVSAKNDYSFINNYDIEGTNLKSINYSVYIKQNFKENYFLLKFCDKYYDCKVGPKMPYDIEKEEFKTKIASFVNNDLKSGYSISPDNLIILYTKIKSYNEKKVIEENTKEDKKIIDDLVQKIDNMETQYSGVLRLNKNIRVYKNPKKCKCFMGIFKCRFNCLEPIKDRTFQITDTAYLRIFNNKVKDILIRGYLKGNEKDKDEIKFRVTNIQNSIPMRALNNSTHFIPISPNDNDDDDNKDTIYNKYDDDLYINVNDLFDYDNHNSWNYSARNKEYNITPEKPIKLEQRKLMDYFTAVIFSDFLGVNNENANSLIQAEARMKIPIWIFNYYKTSYFHSLNVDVNTTLYNGFDDSSRFIVPMNQAALTPDNIPYFKINNFDYIKHNNFNAGISMNFLNYEWKGLSTEWSLAYGIRYYRAGLRFTYQSTGEDIVKDYQLNALSHEISTNFEIRPQLNFGADINFAFNWINARGATDNIPIVFNEDNNNDDKSVLRFQLNLYTKVSPDTSNDGIYARLGGYYHLGAKDFFPQVLVGYATNLSSFVNKFKKK